MGRSRELLVSFKNELTERFNVSQEEMNRHVVALNERLDVIESHLAELAAAQERKLTDLWNLLETQHTDLWRLLETQHTDNWKLFESQNAGIRSRLSEMDNSLPMTVAMSTSEILGSLTNGIRSDLADTRQEIIAKITRSFPPHD